MDCGQFCRNHLLGPSLRTAFIAAVKRTDTGQLRAELMLGGRSVLAWQINLARDLGCERIICHCDAPGELVLALQQQVEETGGEFHAIRSNLQLASIMRADDELVMLLDGLLADREVAMAFTGPNASLRKGIATIPANHTLAADQSEDFERIDRDRRWAGFAVMHAGQVQKLADLPPDSDAMSLLLRLGLQARVECRDLSDEALEGDRWMLAVAADNLAGREHALITLSAATPAWTGPGSAIGAAFVRRIAPRWLDVGAEVSAGAAALLMITGLALAAFGLGAAGLGAAAAGAFAGAISNAWSGMRGRLWSSSGKSRMASALTLGVDAATAVILVLIYGLAADPIAQIALPCFALGVSHYAGRVAGKNAAAFWRDRSLHFVFFATGAATGFLGETVAIFGLAAMVQLLLRR